jgi:hypothetical protein
VITLPLRPTALASAAAAAALAVEHYAFQGGGRTLKPPLTYVVGLATIGVALTWWCQETDHMDAAWAFWTISGVGGAAVMATYALDSQQGDI